MEKNKSLKMSDEPSEYRRETVLTYIKQCPNAKTPSPFCCLMLKLSIYEEGRHEGWKGALLYSVLLFEKPFPLKILLELLF